MAKNVRDYVLPLLRAMLVARKDADCEEAVFATFPYVRGMPVAGHFRAIVFLT